MEGYLALIKEQREENDRLQEENERLKYVDDSNRCLRSANATLNERCHSYRILYEDYKSRCKRAIEIIDMYGCYNSITEDKLYSCLRGDDNETN